MRGRSSADDNDARGAGRIALGYLLIGIAVLVTAEIALAGSESIQLRIAAHLAFLAVTGAVLMGLARRELRQRRHTEQRVENAQRLEALGRLAGGVAHDFNNLLTVMLGYSELVQGRLPAGDPSREDLDAVLRAGEKARSLVDQLLTLSNRGVTNPVVIDPNDTITSLSEVLRRVVGDDVELELDAGQGGRVLIDPAQLGQILLNLVVNAGDAMDGAGHVRIATMPGVMSTGRPAVVIAVTDDGRGMDSETARRCFEPFFTSRRDAGGTGLGLAIVYGAVTQADGEISVASAPGQGTTFTLRLPRAEGRSVVDVRVDAPEGSQTVLLVDDDEAVRTFAERVLAGGGYHVMTASSVAEAFEAISDRGVPDLVVTDVVMPGEGGLVLADRLAIMAPSVPVLLISGFVDDPELRRAGPSADLPLLPKPFHPTDLLRAVADALAQQMAVAQGSNR
jgi:signal transduction histidine kinase/ActR/RegA family two-component response regulator